MKKGQVSIIFALWLVPDEEPCFSQAEASLFEIDGGWVLRIDQEQGDLQDQNLKIPSEARLLAVYHSTGRFERDRPDCIEAMRFLSWGSVEYEGDLVLAAVGDKGELNITDENANSFQISIDGDQLSVVADKVDT